MKGNELDEALVRARIPDGRGGRPGKIEAQGVL